MGRREQIADAGVRLIASGGIRALTHRRVDDDAGLPRGSTSYYARTRRELIVMMVDRLAETTSTALDELAVSPKITSMEAAQLIAAFLDTLARHEDAQAARFALLFELRDDDELRALLTAEAPVRPALVAKAKELLHAAGVADPAQHAADLVGLGDALCMYRTARAAPVDAVDVLRAYLDGLACSSTDSRR
jgi:AcrR family transcriptional regulator